MNFPKVTLCLSGVFILLAIVGKHETPMYENVRLRRNQFRIYVSIGVSGEVIFNSMFLNRKTPLGH